MLHIFRKKSIQRRILIALAVIIIPAFVLWGSGNIGSKRISGSSFVGVISGKKIGIDEFIKIRGNLQIQLNLNYSGQREILETILRNRGLINRLTWERITMLEAAKRLKVKVSDKEVIDFVMSQPLFLQNGKFSEQFYQYVMTNHLRITARTFEEYIRNSLKIDKLRDQIVEEVSVTDDEALSEYKKDSEKGKVSYVAINTKDFEKGIKISAGDIHDYYESHKKEFIIAESVVLQYIEFPYTNLTEKQALMRVVAPVYEKVKKDPARFHEAAEEAGLEVKETGAFFKGRPYPQFNFNSEAYDKIFRMKKGNLNLLSDASASGAHYIIKVKEKKEKSIRPEDEVRSIIEAMRKREQSSVLAKAKADEAYDLARNKKVSIEKVSSKLNLKLLKTDFITRKDYVEGVGVAFDILDEMFKEKPKAVKGPFKTRRGYIIVRLDDFQGIDEAAFEGKKEEYRNKVLTRKKTKAMQDWFEGASKNTRLAIDLKDI